MAIQIEDGAINSQMTSQKIFDLANSTRKEDSLFSLYRGYSKAVIGKHLRLHREEKGNNIIGLLSKSIASL